MSTLYLILVSYDIADPRRLRRVARTLEEVGDRIQKSVFECGLTPAGLQALRLRLRRIIDPVEDHILIQPVCRHCRWDIGWQGKSPAAACESFWIV